jgi:hypothetical protein
MIGILTYEKGVSAGRFHKKKASGIKEKHFMCQQWRIPRIKLKDLILHHSHRSPQAGHSGVAKTCEHVGRYYWWPGMQQYITNYVLSCDSCQRNKSSNQVPAGLLQPLPVPSRRWESISMDFITQLPRNLDGHDATWVVVDRLSKYAHFVPQLVTLLLNSLHSYSNIRYFMCMAVH